MKSLLLAATFVLLPGVALADHGGAKAERAAMEAHHKMMAAMNVKPTGNADKDFVLMMIPHHQGAIDMAKIQLDFGHDPAIRALAQGIIAAQEKEIGEMQEWLKANP
jgi:uncharacterized protein (DUF305 family)